MACPKQVRHTTMRQRQEFNDLLLLQNSLLSPYLGTPFDGQPPTQVTEGSPSAPPSTPLPLHRSSTSRIDMTKTKASAASAALTEAPQAAQFSLPKKPKNTAKTRLSIKDYQSQEDAQTFAERKNIVAMRATYCRSSTSSGSAATLMVVAWAASTCAAMDL